MYIYIPCGVFHNVNGNCIVFQAHHVVQGVTMCLLNGFADISTCMHIVWHPHYYRTVCADLHSYMSGAYVYRSNRVVW